MVCDNCQSKLKKIITPNVRRTTEERNTAASKLNENKLLTSKSRSRLTPYGRNCKLCKCSVHLEGAHYCNGCAYKKGICSMCGKKVVNTKMLNMSTT